jgi:hypothetical protein
VKAVKAEMPFSLLAEAEAEAEMPFSLLEVAEAAAVAEVNWEENVL